jgi:Fe-S cluster assembly protein SufD
MSTFADSAQSHLRAPAKQQAWEAFSATGLPTTQDEVWRYAPLADLDLDDFVVASTANPPSLSAFAQELKQRVVGSVVVHDGFLISAENLPTGVTVEAVDDATTLDGVSMVDRYQADSFALLNAALAPATLRLNVAANTHVDGVVAIINVSTSSASFARVHVNLEKNSSLTLVEYLEGGENGLVVPVEEYHVGEGSNLRLITYQRLAKTAWHLGRTTTVVESRASMSQAFVGIGSHYDRSRNDAVLNGTGAHNELRTTYLGSGSQVHDFRTRQYHVAPRTTSTLLAKGAVADESRSVYTGLIEIEKGAKKTDARQTNHNLLLSRHAHADSVPNLDIRENDVACAHASSVGPLDEIQRWYLESRGVERKDAERLMIQGFFFEMTDHLPVTVAELVNRDVSEILADVSVEAS